MLKKQKITNYDHFNLHRRPYIILKYAVTQNGFLAPKDQKQFWITNSYVKRLVHKWRSEIDAIMVGTNTALIDDPQLTTRYYFGPSPRRIVLDRSGRLPRHLKIFDESAPTLLVTEKPPADQSLSHVQCFQIDFSEQLLPNLFRHLHEQNISKLMIEGGVQLLNSVIEANLWDEARVFIGKKNMTTPGKHAPVLPVEPSQEYEIAGDRLLVYYNKS